MHSGFIRRRRALVAVAAVLLAPALIVGCGDSDETTGTDTAVQTFDAEQLKQPVEVTAGSEFAFVLDSNQTTGYRWEPVGKPLASVVTYEGSDYEGPGGDNQVAGAGGQQTLTYKAVGPGTVEIHLEYAFLGGEQGDKPAEKITAHVTVR